MHAAIYRHKSSRRAKERNAETETPQTDKEVPLVVSFYLRSVSCLLSTDMGINVWILKYIYMYVFNGFIFPNLATYLAGSRMLISFGPLIGAGGGLVCTKYNVY